MSLISMMDENRKMGRGKWNGRTDRGNECALELAQLTARCRDVSRPVVLAVYGFIRRLQMQAICNLACTVSRNLERR